MSSTNRGYDRINEHATPMACAEALCLLWKTEGLNPKRILEPQAGNGNIVRAVRRVWPDAEIVAVEIREECRESLIEAGATKVVTGVDFLTIPAPEKRFDLVIGNPPYAKPKLNVEGAPREGKKGVMMEDAVTEHVQHGLTMLIPGGMLFYLLRLAWVVPRARDELFSMAAPRNLFACRPRPKFTAGASDSVEYAWVQWENDKQGANTFAPTLVYLDW